MKLNRRDFITGAAAFAATSSFASPVASLLGESGVRFTDDYNGWDDSTAKLYIQDGLIAMWDGIENAGWGTHDPNATVWKDLVGGCDCEVVNGPATWGDEYFQGNHSTFFKGLSTAIPQAISAGRFHLDICLDFKTVPTSVDAYRQQGQFGVMGSSTSNRLLCPIWSYAGNIYTTVRNTETRVVNSIGLREGTYTYALDSSGYQEIFGTRYSLGVGSYSLSSATITLGSFGELLLKYCTYSKIFNIRLYNRSLDDSEKAVNDAIDKERFDLP